MITYVSGNLLNEDTEAIVNTVNCVGVMGKGLALQFKNKFYENYLLYAIACKERKVVPGKMFVHDRGDVQSQKYIINFPTKRHWKDKSKLEDIKEGLDDLRKFIIKNNIKSISIPPLGCGLGGLDWNIVRVLIENKLSNLNCDIRIFGQK